MNGEIGQSIQNASRAMEQFILAFERHIDQMEASGAGPDELQKFTRGIHAVRDSAGIYMSWAKHFAKAVGEEGSGPTADMEDFLDEGGATTDNPLMDR